MRGTPLRNVLLAAVLGLAVATPFLTAQTGPQPGPNGFQQRMLDRVKTALNASDEDWKTIQPAVEKVTSLQRDAMSARYGRGGRGGGGATDNAPLSPVAQKAKDLQTVLDNKDAKPEEIKAKLTALREARAKAQEDLTKARQELTELLTQRQEAVLVQMGILE